MKMSIERLLSRWRTIVTTAFVLIAFAAPSTKGIFGKIFNVYATGGNNQGNNNNNNSNSGNSSQGSPQSRGVASPDAPSSRHNQPNAH